MRKVSCVVVGLCSFALGSPAWGQARDPASAESLFRQGRQAMEAKNFAEACPRFAESQKLDPASGTLMNLATCEERLGKLASAWQHWKEAIDALPPKDDRIPFARSRVDELEKKLPRLKVTLAGGADPGSRVFRDEIDLGPASQGVFLPVDPGPHTVTVKLAGHLPEKVSVAVGERESKQIEVHAGAVDPTAPEDKGSMAVETRPRTLGWIVGGVGLAGVGTGIVTGLMLNDKKNTAEATCPNKMCASQADVDAVTSGKTLLVVNTVGWIAGGIGLGVGAYLLLSPPRNHTTAVVVPTAMSHGGGLSCVGNF